MKRFRTITAKQLREGYAVYDPRFVDAITMRPFVVIEYLSNGGAIVEEPSSWTLATMTAP